MATPCIDCRVSPDETSRDEIQVITREKLLEGDMTMMLRSLITIGLILASPSSNIAHTGGRASTPQTTPRDATPPSGRGSTTSATRSKMDANLLQLMQGIVPASNVAFAGQRDLSGFAAAPDPAVSPNPLTSTCKACGTQESRRTKLDSRRVRMRWSTRAVQWRKLGVPRCLSREEERREGPTSHNYPTCDDRDVNWR